MKQSITMSFSDSEHLKAYDFPRQEMKNQKAVI